MDSTVVSVACGGGGCDFVTFFSSLAMGCGC